MKKQCCLLLLAALCGSLLSGCGKQTSRQLVQLEDCAHILPDGTILSTWQYEPDNRVYYCLSDNTQLLSLEETGPADVISSNTPSLSDLSEEAQANILQVYEAQGRWFSLDSYLNRAYQSYRSSPASFETYVLRQTVFPDAASDTVIYFTTAVDLPQTGQEDVEIFHTFAFDRDSGEQIDGWDLFSGSEEEVAAAFLSQLSCSEEDMDSLIGFFQPEYLRLFPDGYQLTYPASAHPQADSLEDQSITLGGDYTQEMLDVIWDWALPTQGTDGT